VRTGVAVSAVGLVGCGGSSSPVASRERSAGAPGVQVSSTTCTTVGARGGRRVDSSYCVYVLSDGRRFRCPSAASRALQTASSLTRNRACTHLTALVVAPSELAAFAALDKARLCLTHARVRVSGGPIFPPQGKTAPVGELIIVNGSAPIFIAFYRNGLNAELHQPEILRNARRLGGRVERRGAATIVSTRPVTAEQRQALERCRFG
jgi:hypothetical protein